jgi:hypothetical protein
MRRLLLLGALFLILGSIQSSQAFEGAMSDSAAMTQAIKLWGPHGAIAKFRAVGATYWTTQIGCNDPISGFLIVAQGTNTWDDAFAKVNLDENGPRKLTATATQSDGQKAVSLPISVYICNVPH